MAKNLLYGSAILLVSAVYVWLLLSSNERVIDIIELHAKEAEQAQQEINTLNEKVSLLERQVDRTTSNVVREVDEIQGTVSNLLKLVAQRDGDDTNTVVDR